LGYLDQEAFGEHGVWLRRQWRAVASGGNAIGEAIDLLLNLLKGPESALDRADLVGVRSAKHLKLSFLEKLDAHAKQPDAVSRVLAVVAKSCHQYLAFSAHVRAVARETHFVQLGLRITRE